MMNSKYYPLIFVNETVTQPPKSYLVGSMEKPYDTPQKAEEAARTWLDRLRQHTEIDAAVGHAPHALTLKGLARGFIRYFPGVQE